MKPVVIDRSLVDMNIHEDSEKKEVFFYVCSLAEAGASYIELGLDAAVKLPRPSGAEKYIYRIDGPEEYVVANAFAYSYAVVPLKYSQCIPKLTVPVILEVDTDGSDVFETLRLVAGSLDISRLSMLRLTGNFEPERLAGLVSNYKRKTVIPIDICPKNDCLSALSCAIAAYKAKYDSVTVSFGNSDRFASLEEFLIMLSAVHKIIVSPDYLTGICKASLLSALICETKVTNLSIMMRKYMYCPLNIEMIDGDGELERPAPVKRNNRLSAAAKAVYALGVEREMSENIIKVLENCKMEFSAVKRKPYDTELQ
ncbi:MAG: hypothetical protein LBI36_00270 [Oscillospiraceae bacterium]|nr:hypothetical protein [Oscillospiraceae bacterium]